MAFTDDTAYAFMIDAWLDEDPNWSAPGPRAVGGLSRGTPGPFTPNGSLICPHPHRPRRCW